MATYDELRLRIDRGVSRGSYRILATGPAGEALGRFKLPFSEMELENFVLKLGAPRRGRRRIDSPEMELAKSFGTKLFDSVFEGDVRELFRSSYANSRNNGRGLRVSLSLTGVPELLEVPWEYLYDHPTFLSISTWTPVVRYLDLPKPRRPLQIELPLRILGMVSAPNDAEPIDVQQERQKLETALAPLRDAGAIEIDWLEEANLRALQRQLRKADYHVFHYVGHGGFDQAADDGVLLFQDEQGRGQTISGIQLGTILADEVSLRLAILNACEGGRSSLQDPFSGVATSLIEREIPAVIGMQFEITDRAAIVFASEFYAALADGLPVDSAVAEARKAIYADRNDIEWGTPVLFMRVADGRLFDVEQHEPVRPVVNGEVAAALVETHVAESSTDAIAAPGVVDDVDSEADIEPRVEQPADEPIPVAEEPIPPKETTRAADEPVVAPIAAAAAMAPALANHIDTAGRDDSPDLPPTADGPAGVASAAIDDARTAAPGLDIPESVSRAFWRAGLGAFLSVVLGNVWYMAQEIEKTGERLPFVIEDFPGHATLTVIATVAAVVAVEYLVPALRIPAGAFYRIVGGNRLAAAGIEGAIAAATVGWAVLFWLFSAENAYIATLDVVVDAAVVGAISFVAAEAAIEFITRRRSGASTEA